MSGPPAPLDAWIDVALRAVDASESMRRVATAVLDDWNHGRVHVLGVGKAVRGMVAGLARALPDAELVGSCIEKVGSPRLESPPPGILWLPGDHPIPGARSFESSRRLVEAIAAWPDDARVVALVSGGTSALLSLPAPGDRADLIELTRRDLGLEIAELNRRRCALDPLKAGGLAERIAPRTLRGFVLDDVPTAPDPLATVGSGPTVTTQTRSAHTIVASNETARSAIADAAREWGARVVHGRIEGVASEAGQRLARELLAANAKDPTTPVVVIAGGESSVTVTGHGVGGRNQELALGAAGVLAGHDAILLALATDGEDGPTDAAGAWVDGMTAGIAGPKLGQALTNNDAYPLLAELDRLICTGRTGTNVADIVVAIANSDTGTTKHTA